MVDKVARFSVSVDPQVLKNFDETIYELGYNRSTAIETAMRDYLSEHKWEQEDGYLAGAITIFYDHHLRGLSEALTESQHGYSEVISSTTHVHLDHDNCLEIIAVRGKASRIKSLYEEISAVRGVKQIKISLINVNNPFIKS